MKWCRSSQLFFTTKDTKGTKDKWLVVLSVFLALLALACNVGQAVTSTPAPIVATEQPAATLRPAVTRPAQSERRCGDGVCDGPENATNCAQDCAASASPEPLQVSPESVEASPAPAGENAYWVTNPASGARLYVQVVYPQGWGGEALPALVLVPGGSADSSAFMRPPSKARLLADQGFAVVVFDPDGRGRSEGTENDNGYVHQDGLAEVIRFAVALPGVDAQRMILVFYSYGVTMAAGALARYPDLPVHGFIDWEGPANRNDTGGCDEARTGHLIGHPCDDEDFWREREAATFALHLRVPYQRIQSEVDHAQPDNAHALLMIANATAEEYGGHGGAPWTRLNDLTPNTVYSITNPPQMIPEGEDRRVEERVVRYARDLLSLP